MQRPNGEAGDSKNGEQWAVVGEQCSIMNVHWKMVKRHWSMKSGALFGPLCRKNVSSEGVTPPCRRDWQNYPDK